MALVHAIGLVAEGKESQMDLTSNSSFEKGDWTWGPKEIFPNLIFTLILQNSHFRG